jgi:glycosyltransferase involved in cell wall biosynthesis
MHKLNLIAPINPLGYGVVGLNILKQAVSRFDVSLFPISNISVSDQKDLEIVEKAIYTGKQFEGFVEAPSLKIWHEFDLADRIGCGTSFAFPFFEINKFDQRRINHLSSVDHIIIASKWAEEIIHNNIPSASTHVVPLGVNSSIFTDGPHQITDKCVFFNCGKWEKRKGHDILLEIFKQAFPNEQDVELWMMCSNPFLPPKIHQEWERYYKTDIRVRLLDRVQGPVDVAKVMASTNCGIFPSRAEGWNLELLEMMSMGKHVIATNYSAHTEFCNNKNCSLIDITNLENIDDDVFFKDSMGEWASLDQSSINQSIEHMRSFYHQWKLDHSISNKEGIKTANEFSWTNTIDKLEETIYGTKGTKTQ